MSGTGEAEAAIGPGQTFRKKIQKVAQRGRRQNFSKSCEVPSRKFWRMCNAAVRSGDVSARRAAGNATICKWHCVPAPPVTSRSILWTQPYFRVNHLLTSAGRTQPPPSKAPTETHADAGGGYKTLTCIQAYFATSYLHLYQEKMKTFRKVTVPGPKS